DRQPGELALQVVERRVDRGARGELTAVEPRLDVVHGERVVAEDAGVLLDIGQGRVRGLAVALDRVRLTVTGDAVVRDLDLDDVGRVLRLPRDHERLGEL